MESKPPIDHYETFTNGEWRIFSFLPIFSGLKWAQEMPDAFCAECPFACYHHPMVRDVNNKYKSHKLCTLFVVKAGLIDIKTVFGDKDHDAKLAKKNVRKF